MSSRTKPLPPGVPDKETRVRHLMRLMSSGEYYGYNTCYRLVEEWGVSFHSLKQDVAEAGRFLRLPPEEREQRRAELSAWAMKVAEMALTSPNLVTGLPDYKAALEANRLAAIWQGISDRVEPGVDEAGKREPVQIQVILAEDPKAKNKP